MSITPLSAVEQVLRSASQALSLKVIAGMADIDEGDTSKALRQLAQAGQIELIPGGRNGNRYSWLQTPSATLNMDAVHIHVEDKTEATQVVPEPPNDGPFPVLTTEQTEQLCIVRVPKRKPRVVTGLHRASAAALAAVRNGAPRADVFILQPAGSAKRGALWQPTSQS
ncbi:hypothetical protein RE432_15020 [Pusillimonas sp. SM2304]|uniref:hypothetical protein n=1 Tax=Pusillimonas sp. SM2304 TaxID=3073241 RepID=UPI0028771E70|nr:hypothetical protein [Pusillimonas sp. SM2304]MDS1141751.1 hypothetical protein [Pusillimonas sp. SM2304]